MTWKIHKYLTFKSGSSQNGRFQEETHYQNGSLRFQTGELEHMHYEIANRKQGRGNKIFSADGSLKALDIFGQFLMRAFESR